jgi:hypothetical protein
MSPPSCRCWLGRQLRQLKKVPHVIITDGLAAYTYLVPEAKHGLCRLHHQQGVTPWLKHHFTRAEEINARKPVMKQLLQTHDKRTVRRRLARLKAQAPALGITPWVTGVEEKLPQLIASVGSVRLPSTTYAIERFFRAFQRFYSTRGGVHSGLSAKRELLLFMVVYLFTQRAVDGQAPIEGIVPEVRRMPLYRLINDPVRALQQRGHVKGKPQMADFLRPQEAAAETQCGRTMQRSRTNSSSPSQIRLDVGVGVVVFCSMAVSPFSTGPSPGRCGDS